MSPFPAILKLFGHEPFHWEKERRAKNRAENFDGPIPLGKGLRGKRELFCNIFKWDLPKLAILLLICPNSGPGETSMT